MFAKLRGLCRVVQELRDVLRKLSELVSSVKDLRRPSRSAVPRKDPWWHRLPLFQVPDHAPPSSGPVAAQSSGSGAGTALGPGDVDHGDLDEGMKSY